MNCNDKMDWNRGLSKDELRHIEECSHCSDSYKLYFDLVSSSKKIKEEIPPSNVLDSVMISLKSKKINGSDKWFNRIAIAASIGFVIFGGLSIQEYRMEITLEKLIAENRALETEFYSVQNVDYAFVKMKSRIHIIERELWRVESLEKKLSLLEQRKKHLLELIEMRERSQNEYSI